MASDFYVQLDRVGRLLRELPEKHDPLPQNILRLIDHAYDDVLEARGKPRENERFPDILGHFDEGDEVGLIVQSYTGPSKQIVPDGMLVPWVRAAKIIRAPRRRSPSDMEPNVGGKPWFFTSDLPVTTAVRIDATMHLELESDRREVFHLSDEHWSTWHEKNGAYWTILTIFRDHVKVTEVHQI